MKKLQIIIFLGRGVEEISDCATNKIKSPGSPPTLNNSAYSSQKEDF